MTPAAILQAAELAGLALVLDGEQVRVSYPGDRRQELAPLVAALRTHRDEIRRLLKRRRRSVDRRPQEPSRFCLFHVGQRVWTPFGPGIVVALHPDRASVQYEDGRRMGWFHEDALLPMA